MRARPGLQRKARLAKKGWKFGSAETFLRLTTEESAYIETTLSRARPKKITSNS
jgi:hypothetical protein